MQLSKYISDLLYRYECVIVPGFGGFISNNISSSFDEENNRFTPPTKQISFNSQLVNNDGLLANYMAMYHNMSFETALDKIQAEVSQWKTQLCNSEILLEKLGSFSLNSEGKITFEPLENTNYLASSYGLDEIITTVISRDRSIQKEVIAMETSEKRKAPAYLKYAATIAAFLTIGSLTWNHLDTKATVASAKQQQAQINAEIQKATFTISTPLPAINLEATKRELPKNFHIIAGAFSIEANALKKVKLLEKKGFSPKILGKNKWGLTQVAFESYSTREEAAKNLEIIKKNVAKDAWLYVQ